MKLELKHLAPYLPYNLKCIDFYKGYKKNIHFELTPIELYQLDYDTVKPILRPLSDLTKEIEHNGEKFVPLDKLTNNHRLIIEHKDIISDYLMSREQTISFTKRIEKYICFNDIINLTNDLYSIHFDVFGLIKAGLALDINTLNK